MTSHSSRCSRRIFRAVCGGPLEFSITLTGRVVARCPWCERYDAGRCFECGRPVYRPRARRCWECRTQARREATQAWRRNYPERDQVRRRKPEAIAAKRIARRRWAERNPLKVALSNRRKRVDPELRARVRQQLRDWRQANPDKVAASNRRRRIRYALMRAENSERYQQRLQESRESSKARRANARAD